MEDREMNGSPVISSFRDLRVWQLGMDLVEMTYKITQAFPRSELYGLAGQMRRAAISIPSNIAEGHTREYTKEYLQFVAVAQGSLSELQTQAEIAWRLHYILEDDWHAFSKHATTLARQLYSLRNSLSRKSRVQGVGNGFQPLTPSPQPQKV